MLMFHLRIKQYAHTDDIFPESGFEKTCIVYTPVCLVKRFSGKLVEVSCLTILTYVADSRNGRKTHAVSGKVQLIKHK
jgi:hypothetical protein